MSEFLDILKKEEVKKFIFDNRNFNPQKLILNPPKQFKSHIKLIADQILSRQKAKGKLDPWAKNFDLMMPPPLSIEQSSSESSSNYKKKLVSNGSLFDLTGGMGIDCIALSEKFHTVTYIEKEKALCEVFEHNCDILNKSIRIVNDLAENVIASIEKSNNDIVFFIDPARRDESKNKVFKLEDCTPNLNELAPLMRSIASQVLVKLSPLIDIKSILSEFDNVKEIHVVSVKNDCKELLILIDYAFEMEPIIHDVNLETDQPSYSFYYSEEEICVNAFGELEEYLFEPNASILKSGAFKKIGFDCHLKKLHQHTHLYTSSELVKEFPGKIFKVLDKADKKSIQHYQDDGKINVMTRNYPIKPDALKKKWKLKDGGNYFLIGFKDGNEKPNLVIAERVY